MPRRRRRRIWAAGLALVLLTEAGAAAEAARTHFIADRRCWVDALLASIHERGPTTTSRDRFVTLSLVGPKQAYVQCICRDDDTRMLCEASSGVYRYPDDQGKRLDMSRDAVAALEALGFTLPDPKGNFAREIDLGSPPRLEAATTLMLAGLYDAYQADATSILDWNAPMAAIETTRCDLAYFRNVVIEVVPHR